MRTKKVTVVFRKWKPAYGCGIIALFPKEIADDKGLYCESYEHIGQHGGADYKGVIASTTPATQNESKELHCELKSLGYRLAVSTHENLTTPNHAKKHSDIALLYKGNKGDIDKRLNWLKAKYVC